MKSLSVLIVAIVGFSLAPFAAGQNSATRNAVESLRQRLPQDDDKTELYQSFAEAIESDNPEEVFEMMTPELRDLVDEPILAKLMAKIKSNLGDFKSVDSASVTETDDASGLVSSRANLTFEKGTANVTLSDIEGKLMAFEVNSDQLENWFDGVDSTDLYQSTGAKFIRHFMMDQADEAFAMCHPALQEIISDGKLQEMIDRVVSQTGSLKTVKFENAMQELNEETQKIIIYYTLECENANASCELTFQLVGMKGYLLGFDIN